MGFENRHPSYLESKKARDRAMDLYEGGRRVEGKSEYLVRHPYETDKQYQIRLERSAYRNLAAPIVDVFSSYICDKRPARTLPKELEAMLADVDRRQTVADVFFANQARLAAARGVSFVLCDMEKSAGASMAEARAAGRREMPYFVAIEPDDVWDWHMDDRGLEWCVIHSIETLDTAPFGQRMCRPCLTVWRRDGWQRYAGAEIALETTQNDIGAGGYELIDEGEHPVGEVPLSPILFEPVTLMNGNPATDDVLSLILRVYRRDSELDKMLFDCAVPLAIINGLEPDDKEKFIRSSSNILVSSLQGGISAQYLEPSGQSFAALREMLDRDIESVREIALRMVRPLSAQAISAEAKSLDKQQLDTQLANFARRCANAEKRCFEMAYKWLQNGRQPEPDTILCPYNEDYSLGEMEKLDRAYLLQMFTSDAISQETYLKLLQQLNVLNADFDVKEALASASREIKDSEGPSGVSRAGQSLLELANQTRP